MKKFSHEQVREVVAVCSGAVMLLAIALILSGSTTFLPSNVTVALQQESYSQSAAAVWWNTYPQYDIYWPRPHDIRAWTSAMGGVMPSYFDAYVTNDPSQYRLAKVVQGAWIAFVGEPPPTGPTYTGASSLTVPAGSSVTLEWACQDWASITYSYSGIGCQTSLIDGVCLTGVPSSGGTGYTYYYNPAVGINFTAGSNIGSATVVPTQTTTYGMYCPTEGWRFCTPVANPYNCYISSTPVATFTVNVNGSAPPTVAITGNGQSPSVTVPSGTPVNIVATFDPSTSYTGSAINDFQNNAITSQSPSSPKTYTFNSAGNPAAVGSYVFNSAVQTSALGWANNFGKVLTINVTAAPAACPANCPGSAAPTCTANSGYTYNSANNTCAANACSGGQINPPACTLCSPGFHNNAGNVCMPDTCSDPHALAPLCTSCVSGYTMQAGTCVITPPALTLTAAQSSVRKGIAASLSWSVNGLVAGSGEQCSINSNPTGVFAASMPANTAPSWSGSNVATGAINGTTVFTLSCTGAASVSQTVKIIPSFQEI